MTFTTFRRVLSGWIKKFVTRVFDSPLPELLPAARRSSATERSCCPRGRSGSGTPVKTPCVQESSGVERRWSVHTVNPPRPAAHQSS